MINRTALCLLSAIFATTVPRAALAQDPDSARIAELERKMEAVTRELERVRLGRDVVEADSSVLGLGPGASKIYRVNQGVSLGGYGEVLYENFAARTEADTPADTPDQLDALRAVLYVGYKFNDRLLFNSEIELEHADEVFLEFAYLDYLLSDDVGVRAGMLLAPLGLVNELHEPTSYLGTERPLTESRIIPTTWRENGVGAFGGNDEVAWRVYVMNSLDGSGFGASGLRGGRQKGSHALAEDLGVAARLDYVGRAGLIVGGSAYTGETAQGRDLDGIEVGGRLTIWDVHANYEVRGWALRALVAGARLDDVEAMNRLNGLSDAAGIGSSMLGWYAWAGYDVLRAASTSHQLIPYARYERVNTQREVATGFTANPANDVTITSVGVAWKPVPQVVAKLGYQLRSTRAESGVDQLDVHLGWLF